jgi:hypothetical protein
MFGGKWAEFWLLVRNTSVDSELVSLWHSAVVGIGGGFYLNNQQVSAEQMGTFIAELCDGDKSRAQALFQSALAGEALSARW